MSKQLGRMGTLVGGAATLAMLGFGTAQAFASPGAATQAPRYCGHDTCSVACQEAGYRFGRCDNWVCMCNAGGTLVPL